MGIEDYGLIGDMRALALVGRDGASAGCVRPRFDSASCFSARVGDEQHGRWVHGPVVEARALFERLLGLRNDLGLLSDEYDVPRGRQVGNFPQAFSHLTLIVAARAIAPAEEAARRG